MEHVLTVVAAGRLADDVVTRAAEAMPPGAARGEPKWLAMGTACDLPFEGVEPETVEQSARAALHGAAVDLAVQLLAGRRKRLLVADMESTVIANEMLDDLGGYAGKRREIEAITASAMRGELDFEGAVRRRVALLRGLGTEVLERALAAVEVEPGARALVATMAAGGAFTALVSGGFGIFAEPIAERLGFDAWRANHLQLSDGVMTGHVIEPILGRDAKAEALEDYCRQQNVTPADVVAVGDGANDLGMLHAAGVGVAYHAKPTVAEAARYRVDHGDLSTLLYFQGYGEGEIVGG